MRQRTATTRPASNSRETVAGEFWLLIETPTDDLASVVFESGKVKQFTSVSRRQCFKQPGVTAAITAITDQVRAHGEPQHTVVSSSVTSETHLRAAPVLGPSREVFAVQVMISGTDHPDRFVAGRRRCGAFTWDPSGQVFHLGPTTATDLVGASTDSLATRRVSHEVFSLVDEFPGMAALGDWVAGVKSGRLDINATFCSDILLKGIDRQTRSAFVSLRAVETRLRNHPVVRGLVHDISDIRAAEPTCGHNAALLRSAIGIVPASINLGIGHINFATGVILEWYRIPPAPLDRWCRQNAEFRPSDMQALNVALGELKAGVIDHATLQVRLRFDDTTWIPVQMEVHTAQAGPFGQGLLTVKHLPVKVDGRVSDTFDSPSMTARKRQASVF